MSTGIKMGGIIALVAAAVIGVGCAGAQVTATQSAATPSAQTTQVAPGAQGQGGPNGQFVPGGQGFQRGPMMGGQFGPGGQGSPRGPMMGGAGGRDGNGPGPMMGIWVVNYRDEMNAALAKALGVTGEEYYKALAEGKSPRDIAKDKGISDTDFRAKLEEATAEAVKQAVTNGKLTQSQADEIMAQVKQANEIRDLFHAALAQALGMTTTELDKALADGKSPRQIAQEKGISDTDFRAKLSDALAAALKQAVADGKLTQAQADDILARMQRSGGPGMMWGPHPGWDDNDQ